MEYYKINLNLAKNVNDLIEKIEIEKETRCFVYYKGSRWAKESDYICFTSTFKKALKVVKNWTIQKITAEQITLKIAQREIKKGNALIKQIDSL
jgi:hypothetical protein